MKSIVNILICLCLIACNNDPRSSLSPTGAWGEPIENTATIDVKTVLQKLHVEQQIAVTTKGTIVDFCKGEGCWLTLQNEGGDPLWVEIKDNAFVLPYHIDGKTAIVQGVAVIDSSENGKPSPKLIATGIKIN
ncbi:MAG: DUF4920 domain-containing protein [Bacteroidetes bacterium]|nr:MAG: DUF4920 domain-containing protein [Bacteroidota bacterium]